MKDSNKTQKFVNFYNKNYKILHHLVNIPLFFGIAALSGNKEFITQIPLTLLGLVICYFTTTFIIKIVDSN